MVNIKHRIIVSAAVFLLFIGNLNGQPAVKNFDRASDIDIQHYTLNVRFDRPKKTVIGETTVRLKPLKDIAAVELDAIGITFTAVSLVPGDTPLKFSSGSDKIKVTLDRTYRAGDELAIRFVYSAVPKKGVYFVEPKIVDGKTIHGAQIWTQGEADEARHWFPSFDFPSDKATSEQFITAEKGESVIGNGETLETRENADGTVTHHFRMPVPHSTYLTSFIVGNYKKVEDKYKQIPLGFYVYPEDESIVPLAYGNTKEMFSIFEGLTGIPYPYNKYDQTVVGSFQFGGMENITATTMADTEIAAARIDFIRPLVEDLVSHELAHSWFGNLVTCRNWAELWLNEGFATFMEAAYREKKYGRENYLQKVSLDADQFLAQEAASPKPIGLYNQTANNVAGLFDRPTVTYNKGGAVIHTLREQVGDEAFWKGVNAYLNAHKFGNVVTGDLKKAMEDASGQDLAWFFDQWVYGGGAPRLNIMHSYRGNTLSLTVDQVQKAGGIVPAAFRLPLEVEFTVGSERVRKAFEVTRRNQTFTFKVEGKPSNFVIDPDMKVPVKIVKLASTETKKKKAKK